MLNFHPKNIVILESTPRVLELRPPEQYVVGEPVSRPFDMHALHSHAPIEWMVDMENTDVSEVGPSPIPPRPKRDLKAKSRKKN